MHNCICSIGEDKHNTVETEIVAEHIAFVLLHTQGSGWGSKDSMQLIVSCNIN
jgi:hypothetical protein